MNLAQIFGCDGLEGKPLRRTVVDAPLPQGSRGGSAGGKPARQARTIWAVRPSVPIRLMAGATGFARRSAGSGPPSGRNRTSLTRSSCQAIRRVRHTILGL